MHLFRKFILIAFVFTYAFSAKAQTVFKTPSGEKYHLASCRMVKNVSAEITIAEAKKMGLQPCKICKPQDIYGQSAVNIKAQGQNATVQCKGLTKAGSRCKHKTSIADGY